MINREVMLSHIGHLARMRRNEKGVGLREFARMAEIGSTQTVQKFETGEREPNPQSLRKLEDALSWSPGVISRLLDAADGDLEGVDRGIDMAYMDGWTVTEPVSKASELTDLELLTETIARLHKWEASLKASENKSAQSSTQAGAPDEFALAAHTGMSEGKRLHAEAQKRGEESQDHPDHE
ncbi:MAG: helix-turn-helix transcriptional regulator [Renibacterium salmoninarum]|nr:helix-turn-helix transcriptional regulator [Renibacterium salmoninarum]